MSAKAKIEAIIYAAEEPVTVEQIAAVLKGMGEAPASETTEKADAPEGVVPEVPAEAGEADARSETSAGNERKPRKPDALGPLKAQVRTAIEQLTAEYAAEDRGIEVRAVAGGYRFATKPEHHDAVRAFARGLKPPVRLSLPSLETLAVIAYKQPITAPEIGEIRGVDASGVIGTLLDRKLIATAGRKQVVGRPILYKTTREFLLRFGLNDLAELPSMEEFEKLMSDAVQEELETPTADLPANAPEQPVST